ncbi:TonB-dependent receptor [Bosea sp. NBC_00550]|uniref:TonB-dependent receptor n=1 Tax=Bosea sp. NBC_00550 TaxID=2969621 RepID=UPI0022311447|nr:TonB-dependent receptor [Bosea sp. NBC_00550]UZF91946.1 TonB-dependent receptor [Bosea sp. NBC_00550]
MTQPRFRPRHAARLATRLVAHLAAGTAFGSLLSSGALAQGAIVLPEITVTAPSPIQPRVLPEAAQAGGDTVPLNRSFSSVTVLTAPDILRNGGRTLGDQLANEPGITNSGFAPGGADRPVIRGLDNVRVRIQENGIGSQDVSDLGEDHGVPIDPLAAQRIEVIRGPGTLRYGSQAIGGVVSVENNRIPSMLIAPGFHAETRSSVSSVDNGFENSALIDARSGQFVIHGDIYHRNAEDYRIPGGRQFNSFSRSHGQAIGGTYFLQNGFIGFSLSHFTSLYGIPGNDAAQSRTRIDLEQTRLASKGEFQIDGGFIDTIRYWVGGSVYRHDEKGLNGDGLFETAATFKNREVEGRVEAQLKPVDIGIGRLTSAFGVQFGRQEIGTAGEAGGLLLPATTQTAALYNFNELQLLPGTKLQAAGRIDYARVSGTGAIFPADLLGASGDPTDDPRTRRFVPLSASIGLLQDLPYGFVASLAGSYIERAPKAAELFSRGAHDAPGTFEIGDPNLRKEAAKTVELGLRRSAGPWRFDASLYATRYEGFIYRHVTGTRCDDEFTSCGTGDELTQVIYSQRNATFLGGELKTQYDLFAIGPHVFGIEGQYDIVRAKFSGGENVPRIPPQRLGGGLFWRGGESWQARVTLLHAFSQKRTAPEETTTDGYNLLNAELSYRFKIKESPLGPVELTAGVNGTNLLNETIRNAVSFRKDEVVLPGRGVRAFLSAKF